MGYGLGKNSPIVLTQSRENFEALIGRHGQWVRWRRARKCPCVTAEGEPDIHCGKCGGTGEIYSFQESAADAFDLVVRGGVCDMGERKDAEVVAAFGADGGLIDFERIGDFLKVSRDGKPVSDNEIVSVNVKETIARAKANVRLHRVAGDVFRAGGLVAWKSAASAVSDAPPCDVVSLGGIFDGDGNEYASEPFSLDCVRLRRVDGEPIAEDAQIFAERCSFVEPFCFAVLSQTGEKKDADFARMPEGDAQCSFPYKYAVGEGDLMTVFAGSQVRKGVFASRGGDFDVLPDEFVESVESVESSGAVFESGVDFSLLGANRLMWIGGRRPAAGDALSVVWRAFPTYRVSRELPQLRTSECQRLPRRVSLRLLSAFQETRGV